MENITYKLEAFQGPLDLLLKLIDKNKVEITDIPIALIFDQYMEHIEEMQKMDMEVAGEFIVMASELMLIKSKMLLPKPEDEEEDPRAKLAAMLLEYQKMKQAAGYLSEQFGVYSGRMVKDTDEVKPDSGKIEPQQADALRRVMLRMLRTMDKNALDEANREAASKPFERILRTPIVPVSGKIYGVIRYLVKNGEALYTSILLTAKSRSELIATFLAVLELMKKNRVTLRPVEETDFGEITDFRVNLNHERMTGGDNNVSEAYT